MQLSFNILDFLMLSLVVQGFVLSGLLFYSSKTIISNRYLGSAEKLNRRDLILIFANQRMAGKALATIL